MLDTLVTRQQSGLLRGEALINGSWVVADDGRTFDIDNPATGQVVGSAPLMGADETRRAIEAADAAFPAWAGKTAQERADILFRWHTLILQHADELTRLLTLEQGKPIAEARGEVMYAAAFVQFYAEEARRTYGETIPSPRPETRILVLKQPLGVVACIIPWNFPAAMVTRKVAPAIAVGCTVVLKPAEATPLSALALASLALNAGLPRGVLNIVTGDPQAIGFEMCVNSLVRKLSFTGSTATGRRLASQSSGTLKRLGLELGGNAPFIVFEDADLEAAVEGAVLSKYRHSGQTCVCTNRFLIHSDVYDEFARRFVERVSKLRVGNGLDSGIDIGPLINAKAIAKVEVHVANALEHGAQLLVGGKRHVLGGNFFEPTILGNVTPDMCAAREETFGPVAALMKFDTEEEAVALANTTEYGLAGYFYSKNNARAWRVSEKLEFGMVGVNSGFLSMEVAPFGGIKQSGMGREGSHHGIDEFLELKFLHIGCVSQA